VIDDDPRHPAADAASSTSAHIICLVGQAWWASAALSGPVRGDVESDTGRDVRLGTPFAGQSLAKISHELRTPLNTIIGFAELMHKGKAGPISPAHQEYLGDIITAAKRLLGVIDELLDRSRHS
jgi:signal transduction histidine kinase